ncbi:eukaryotic translation elongation factor 1 epsilon-1 isoform X2 [Aplysia californica]|uniref:Eukaryotic translation elongation factor 1 epsilon-1 isoform X2 n=1 Tax=Aplysia californica TaxID=6500 RepID=A0ABM1ADZ6_APLCA|nr:eukaryotic translation elongation factor 1 epsilon-1 isoform X2 [Aplysia californica]
MAAPMVATVGYFQAVCGKQLKTNKSDPILDAGNGKKISGLSNIAKHLLRVSDDFKNLSLEERIAAEQWIEYARTEVSTDKEAVRMVLKELNAYLQDKVFFVADRLTVADVFMFHSLHAVFARLTFQEKEKHINVSRWFSNIQREQAVRQNLSGVTFLRTPVYDGVAAH